MMEFTACNNKVDSFDPKITITSDPILRFVRGEELEKTLSFESVLDWNIADFDASWLEIAPMKGNAGKTQLTVKVLDADPTQQNILNVAIVSGTAKAEFTVIQESVDVSKSVEITNAPEMIFTGEEITLQFELPEGIAPKEIVWSSSKENVISVNQDGLIKAITAGTSKITVNVNGYSGNCDIEVFEFKGATFSNGSTYNFKRLSNIEGSGVSIENGEYVVGANFEIAEKDFIVIEDNDVIKIKDGIEILIKGTANFTPGKSSTITRYDDNAIPKSVYFTGANSGGNIMNIVFIDVPIRSFGGKQLTIDNCEFKYIRSKKSAIEMGGTNELVTVANCNFIENSYSAISGAANSVIPLIFKDNYLYKNSANAINRPQINVSVGGDGAVEISGNEVIGPGEITMNGGISVANTLGTPGTNKVLIKNNKVKDCRYGITTNGKMDVQIIGNELIDNKYELNPMNGGSGISIYDNKGNQKVFMSENIITGHLWGITIIGSVANGTGPQVNLGCNIEGQDYNLGKNVFSNNGNNGILYDLYNYSPLNMYAMNNTWGSVDQTEANIEKVIFHKVDDINLGVVTFMPPFAP